MPKTENKLFEQQKNGIFNCLFNDLFSPITTIKAVIEGRVRKSGCNANCSII